MNGWFLTAGALLLVAFFVHSFAGNRLYSAARPAPPNRAARAARPDRGTSRAYDAWLMGRCGMQMIGADLLLAAGFLLASGAGVLPRSRSLELFLLLTYGGWTAGWLLSLAAERSESRHYLRLRQWVLFGVVAVLVGIGIFR